MYQEPEEQEEKESLLEQIKLWLCFILLLITALAMIAYAIFLLWAYGWFIDALNKHS